MTWLVLGIFLWSLVHFFPSFLPSVRAKLIHSVGMIPYKLLFTLVVFASLGLIIYGFRATELAPWYVPPGWGRHAAMFLMLIALMLFAAARWESNIRRVLRHPQLSGAVVWSVAHLLANGESRSVVLFAGLGLWALVQIVLLNARLAPDFRHEPRPWIRDAGCVLTGLVVYVALVFGHRYVAGIPLIGV